MPSRRGSKHNRPHRPLSASHPVTETRINGEWLVRPVPADRALKAYTCPGCGGTIPAEMAHLVIWPRQASIASPSAIEERRHWHRYCWQRR